MTLVGGAPASGRGRVVVLGGGIAGVAASVVLGERGFAVTLVEKEDFLGGRAGAWTDQLSDGTTVEMERGFHAFFRQYYNLRSLMRRVDPSLGMLTPVSDYPLLTPDGAMESFAGLPRRAPFNIVELIRRSRTIRFMDLRKVDLTRAREMLAFDGARTYAEFDRMTAKDFLDGLRFPPEARRVLFDVFAHSFFNPEARYSAAELLAMFHYYFTQNPEGLVFDVMNRPFSKGLWSPMERVLEARGVRVSKRTSAEVVEREDGRLRARLTRDGEPETVDADAVVLALSVPALKALVARSPSLGALEPGVSSLAVTSRFAVQRLWLDRPCRPDRHPFAGTTGLPGFEDMGLDNISLYERLEDESRAWARRTGGSIVELHAYGIDDDSTEADIRRRFEAGMHQFYPETRGARVLDERFLLRQDCPAFQPGSHAARPEVTTPLSDVLLAGDFVKLPFPSALMERAASSGFMAANVLCDRFREQREPVKHGPLRGLFAAFH